MDEIDEIKDEIKDCDYEVGYGKPPMEGRFQKGLSGNPKGRPKGSRNMKTEVNELMQELVDIKENGRTRKMTRRKVLLRQLANKAHAGDRFAMRDMVNLQIRYDDPEQVEAAPPEGHQRNVTAWKGVLKRLSRIGASSSESDRDHVTDSELETV